MEQVNHPKHYNNHPQGLECIDIIRHYTFDIGCAIKYLWRAGLKESFWRSNNDKAVEDLQKALWYINDYKVNQAKRTYGRYTGEFHMAGLIRHETLCSLRVISDGFNPTVAKALRNLLRVGLLSDNRVWRQHNWEDLLDKAAVSIQIRIEEIKEL